MFSVNFWELVVINGFQCAKSRHTPGFQKTRPDTPQKRGRVGEIWTYGNPNYPILIVAVLSNFGDCVLKCFATRQFSGPFLASYLISGFIIHKCCMIPWFPQPLTNEQEVCLLYSSAERNNLIS